MFRRYPFVNIFGAITYVRHMPKLFPVNQVTVYKVWNKDYEDDFQKTEVKLYYECSHNKISYYKEWNKVNREKHVYYIKLIFDSVVK